MEGNSVERRSARLIMCGWRWEGSGRKRLMRRAGHASCIRDEEKRSAAQVGAARLHSARPLSVGAGM
eukprot:3574105-Pleurochrysis_carterae.AAC.1